MIKYSILILFLFLFFSCNNTEENNTHIVEETIQKEELIYPDNYSKREFIDSVGAKTISIDSLHYKINIKQFDERIKVVHRVDTIVKIDSFKVYKNDSLITSGLRTYPNSADIGKWVVKTKEYKDSIINHDKKWKCNYFDALKIVENEGFELVNIEASQGTFDSSDGIYEKWFFKVINDSKPVTRRSIHYIIIDKMTCELSFHDEKSRLISPK